MIIEINSEDLWIKKVRTQDGRQVEVVQFHGKVPFNEDWIRELKAIGVRDYIEDKNEWRKEAKEEEIEKLCKEQPDKYRKSRNGKEYAFKRGGMWYCKDKPNILANMDYY